MKTNARRITTIATAVSLFGALALGGCSNGGSGTSDDASQQKHSGGGGNRAVRIAYNTNAGMLAAAVAQDQGFFKRAGIKVTRKVVNNISTLPPVLGKTFDIVASTNPDVIQANSQGLPLAVVSTIDYDTPKNPTASLIVTQKSGIKDVSDLAGKSLGTLTVKGGITLATQEWAREAGVDPKSITIRQMDGPTMADQIRAGRVDAVIAVAPFTSRVMSVPGTKNIGDPYLEIAKHIADTNSLSNIVWVSLKPWADSHPREIQAFRKGLKRANRFIKNHPDRARSILASYTGLSKKDAKEFPLPTYGSKVRPADLKVWHEVLRNVANFKSNPDLSKMYVR